MSPSEELAEIRRLVNLVFNAGEDLDIGELAEELSLSIDFLDEMLSSGMPLPIDWDKR